MTNLLNLEKNELPADFGFSTCVFFNLAAENIKININTTLPETLIQSWTNQ